MWWICLRAQVWSIWPEGCSGSVGPHLGSPAPASEAWDRWCQPGLGPRAGQGSRDDQPLIYAAAPDRGLVRGLLLRSWPLLVAGSSIQREEWGWAKANGRLRKGGLGIPGDCLHHVAGQLQDLCSMCVAGADISFKPPLGTILISFLYLQVCHWFCENCANNIYKLEKHCKLHSC